MKFLTPIILIVTAVGVFLFYTDSVYRKVAEDPKEGGVKQKKEYVAQLDKQLAQTREILRARGELSEQYKKISGRDLDNLNELLPDHVDNVKLVLDLNGIARNHGMTLRDIKVNEEAPSKDAPVGPDKKPYSQILLSFEVTAPYENFVSFLEDLERSLRIVDVTALDFEANEKGVYNYKVTIKTYWLKK